MALLDKTVFDTNTPITLEEAKHALNNDGLYEESPALRLVLQDALRAEATASSKAWINSWPQAASLYESPFSPSYYEGTQVPRSSVPFYTLATAVNSLVPAIINGLFAEPRPFMVQKRPGTSQLAAEAIGDVLAYQLEDINFREELRLGMLNCCLYGTSVFKWGWETSEKQRKVYRRQNSPTVINRSIPGQEPITLTPEDEEIEEEITTEYRDTPFFEHIVDCRHVLVDPGLNVPDIRKGKYVIHRIYATWEEIDKLRERPGFNIPPKEELLSLFFPPKETPDGAPNEIQLANPLWLQAAQPRWEESSADPFNQPLEILERWDNNKCIAVLQKKLVILNDENPYGEIPFLSLGWWDSPSAFWGMGLSKTVGSEQRLQQGITNLWVDNATLNLNGVYTRVIGKSVPTQSIRLAPGRIINIENQGDFQPLPRLQAVPEAMQMISLSQMRVEQTSASTEMGTQGIAGASGHSNAARTARGISEIAAGTGNRLSDIIDKLSGQVIIPFLYAAHEMNRALLPLSTLRYLLNEELDHEFLKQKGDLMEILNARIKFSILAGSKLNARKAMAQSLPILTTFLTSPETTQQLAIQHKKIDISLLVKMLMQVSEWDATFYDLVPDMTPEDIQRMQAQQQQGAMMQQQKFQQQSQLQNQSAASKAALADQNAINRASAQVLRTVFEKASEPYELSGEPENTGAFGS